MAELRGGGVPVVFLVGDGFARVGTAALSEPTVGRRVIAAGASGAGGIGLIVVGLSDDEG